MSENQEYNPPKRVEPTRPYQAEDEGVLPLKFVQAWVISIIATISIIVVFSLLGSEQNPILGQIDMLLVIVALSLTGILTQSKLRSLIAFPTAILVNVIFYFLPIHFFNPIGLWANLLGKSEIISDNISLISQMLSVDLSNLPLAGIGWGIDLVFLLLYLPLVAILFAALTTGISRNIVTLPFSLIKKIIILVLLLALIITVPFAYIGLAKGAEGVAYMGAGINAALEESGMNVEDIDLDELMNNETALFQFTNSFDVAKGYIAKASDSFGFIQQNILAMIVLNIMGYQDLLELFNSMDALYNFVDATPEVLFGLYNLNQGLDKTFNALPSYVPPSGSTNPNFNGYTMKVGVNYSPAFAEGLDYLQKGVANFSLAVGPIQESLVEIRNILELESLSDFEEDTQQILEIVEGLEVGLPILVDLGSIMIDFVNGTYLSALAINSIGDNDFVGAKTWMQDSAKEIDNVTKSLDFDTTGVWDPVIDAINVFRDMSTILGHFVKGGLAGTRTFLTLNTSLSTLDQVNVTKPPGTDPTNDELWNEVSEGISDAGNYFDNLTIELSMAEDNSTQFANKDYGELGSAFQPTFQLIGDLIGDYKGNLTSLSFMLNAIDGTYNSYYSFSYGVNHLLTYFDTNATSDLTAANHSIYMARANATNAYYNLSSCDIVPDAVKTEWMTLLNDGNPGFGTPPFPSPVEENEDDVIGLVQLLLYTIEEIESADPLVVQAAAAYLDSLNLWEIFN